MLRPISATKTTISSVRISGERLMKNPAPTEFPVNDLIRDRWSPRAFSEKEISPADLRSLFEAARWAPSTSTEQPWAFVVATRHDHDTFEKALQPSLQFTDNWPHDAYI